MQTFCRFLLLGTLVLSACVAIPAPPPTATDTPIAIPTTVVPDTITPPVDSPYTGACGYQWAYQDLPELSSSFQQSLQALQPEAQANTYIFGENCIGEDGTVKRFLAKETDFNVTLQVNDVSNPSELGAWIVKVMQVIEAIPADQIVGPQPGMVNIVFQSKADQNVVNFYINEYQALPAGLSDAEIFQTLQSQ